MRVWHAILSAIAGVAAALEAVGIPPSTNWDGNDGPWSSFTVQIGTPPQAVRVFPSTSGSSLWVVVGEGCTENDGDTCAQDRGEVYSFDDSSSVVQRGIYNLPLEAEKNWGLSGNGQFGFDTMTLSYNGGGGPTLNDSTLFCGIATKSFYIGTLGLTPWGTNFTDTNDPIPSLLTSMKNQGFLESNSWGYTAGMHNAEGEGFGSLTFGGYDESRFDPNDLIITRSQDVSRDLLVGVQSIISGSQSLLPTAITAFIDSTIAQIWLPEAACQRFEEVFGLVWDETVKLYLVNDTLHESLVSSNPSVTFAIGSSTTSTDTVNVNFPYGAFDLTASAPLTANGTSKYFPLRRASNATQYLLGRTFLQQAYLTVDYDRNTFSVAQAVFPETNVPQRLVAISPPGQGESQGLNTGAIVGIAVGGVAVAVIVAVGIWFFIRRRRAKEAPASGDEVSRVEDRKELDSNVADATRPDMKRFPSELTGNEHWGTMRASELGSSEHSGKVELDGRSRPTELQGDGQVRYELP